MPAEVPRKAACSITWRSAGRTCFRKGISLSHALILFQILSLFGLHLGSTAAGLSGKHGDLALQPVDKAM